ncbi:MAG: hypothetical protein NZM15_04335 [Flavobacteriales bacterium]|nr:hypothetical protein [Flavobacteriales bacterium]MDW8431913.1 hypothetical protein [Flavobacteriales bacterium]
MDPLCIFFKDVALPCIAAISFLGLNNVQYRLPLDQRYAVFLFFATAFAYAGQRLVRSFQKGSEEVRFTVYRRYPILWTALLTTFFWLAVFFFLQLGPFQITGICALAIISVAYIWWPVGKRIPLRSNGLLKSFWAAGVWAWASFTLPALEAAMPWHLCLVYTVSRALFVLGLILPFDACQASEDMALGIKTLPVLLGRRQFIKLYNAIWLLYLILEGMPLFIHQGLQWSAAMNVVAFVWLIIPPVFLKYLPCHRMWVLDTLPTIALIFHFLIPRLVS